MGNFKNGFVKLIATGFYSGLLQPWPGTWGSIPPLLLALFLATHHLFVMPWVTIGICLVSIWSANEAEKFMGHDSRSIVIDEWAGMFVSILFLPVNWKVYLIAFVLFRVFDVIKLPPARQLEKLHGGIGVTLDDVVAGIQTNLVVRLILIIFPTLV